MRQLYVQLLFYQVKAIHNIITIGIWYVTPRVRQRPKIELDNELVKLTIMQADVFFFVLFSDWRISVPFLIHKCARNYRIGTVSIRSAANV